MWVLYDLTRFLACPYFSSLRDRAPFFKMPFSCVDGALARYQVLQGSGAIGVDVSWCVGS